jgi:hypothetical protein
MNLKNYYWYFQKAVPANVCDDIVKYGFNGIFLNHVSLLNTIKNNIMIGTATVGKFLITTPIILELMEE